MKRTNGLHERDGSHPNTARSNTDAKQIRFTYGKSAYTERRTEGLPQCFDMASLTSRARHLQNGTRGHYVGTE